VNLTIRTSINHQPTLRNQDRQNPTLTGSGTGTQEKPTPQQGTGNSSQAQGQKPDRLTLSNDEKVIQELKAREREVRAHEAAHAATGGGYADSPTYSYQQGPDGRSYAIGGEVRIDTSKIPGDPQATLKKAETIRAAALAPAQPSSADRAIAAKAVVMAAEARSELASESESESESSQQQSPYAEASSSTTEDSGSLLNRYI